MAVLVVLGFFVVVSTSYKTQCCNTIVSQQLDQLTEEGVVQGDRIDAFHSRILQELGINVEEDWHVHCFASIQPLLFEAEALDLAEVRSHLTRCHTVRRNTNHILLTLVRGCVESQRRLARQHTHFALLRRELPW